MLLVLDNDIPKFLANESEWKLYLRTVDDDDKQIQIMKRAKFIQDFLRMLRFNAEIRSRSQEAMKYDRIRMNCDIRNKSDEQLASYQRSQKRMIEEDNYNG